MLPEALAQNGLYKFAGAERRLKRWRL